MPKLSEKEVFEVRQRLSALNKTDEEYQDIRRQLLDRLEELTKDKTLLERIESMLRRADEIGEVDPDFDMKSYLDEMWGDTKNCG